MKLNRRHFIKAAGVIGMSATRVFAQPEKENRRDGNGTLSKIRVAQIKVYPQKGEMEANHKKLMDILSNIEKNEFWL